MIGNRSNRKRQALGSALGVIVGLFLFVVAAFAASPESEEASLIPMELRIAFTRPSFLGVNEADALAAFKVFTRTVGKRRGYDITPQVTIFDDMNVLREELDHGRVELLIIDSWEYLSLSPGTNMPVEFSTIEQGVVREDYVLLVKADSALAGLADLEGRRVIALESSNANTGRHWLSTELLALGATSPQAFFGHFEVTHKTSQVVLPVFFGQVDACLVDRTGFNVMDEMNPQVGKGLAVVAKSDPLLDTVICVRKDKWENPRHRADLLDAMRELNTDPGGRQILSLFRFQGMTTFERKHMETIFTLRQRHDELKARLASERKDTAEK